MKSTRRVQFASRLAHLARSWRARIDARLASFGLTQARWLILFHLSRGADGLTQKALAALVGVQGPTLVRTLDRLEAEGLVQRRDDPRDRRAKTIHVAARALPVIRKIQSVADEVRGEILAGISDKEIADCWRLFDRIAANLEAERTDRTHQARQTSSRE